MKTWNYSLIYAIMIHVLFSSCQNSTEPSKFRDKYRWIAGKWEGKNGDVTLAEHWKWNKSRFEGVGFEIQNGDTLFSEQLFIESFGESELYVSVLSDANATSFLCQQPDSNVWRFTNPDHNFPSVIQYSQDGDSALTISLFARGEKAFRGEHSYQLKRIKSR